MKRLVLICTLSFISFVLHAQGENQKVLVLKAAEDTTLITTISKFYAGTIDTASTLPVALSQYDAILINSGLCCDSVTTNTQLRLIDYLKHGGRVYYESPSLGGDATDPLLYFTGYKSRAVDAVDVYFSGVIGNDTAFTKGFSVSHEYLYGGQTDGVGYYHGDFIPVLWGQEVDYFQSDVLAWIPQDNAIKAVVHVPFGFGPDKREYYDSFLQLVMCNYFGLCAPMSVARYATPVDFEIHPNPAHTSITISLPADRESSVEIADVLGNVLLRKKAMANMQWKPEHDAAAVYFVRVTTGETVATQRVAFER